MLDIVEITRSQLRAGFDGAYALDWNVIARLADDAGVETTPGWWQLLAMAEAELIRILRPPKPEDAVE